MVVILVVRERDPGRTGFVTKGPGRRSRAYGVAGRKERGDGSD